MRAFEYGTTIAGRRTAISSSRLIVLKGALRDREVPISKVPDCRKRGKKRVRRQFRPRIPSTCYMCTPVLLTRARLLSAVTLEKGLLEDYLPTTHEDSAPSLNRL